MLLLGKDGVVGLQAVLLEHSLIAVVYQLPYSSGRHVSGPYPKPVQINTSVVVHCGVANRVIRTKNVQERVLEAEKLVSVRSHDVSGMLV